MPTAVVCAAFDAVGDAAIAGVQDRLRALGVRVPREPAHRAHLTLAAAVTDAGGISDVAAVAAEVAARQPAFSLALTTIGTFARGATVWLGPPRADAALADLQRAVHDAMTSWPPAFGNQTDPRQWVPHCTLARRAARDTARRLRADFVPIEVRVTALATLLVGGRGDVDLAQLRG